MTDLNRCAILVLSLILQASGQEDTCTKESCPEPEKPNIVIMLADDLGIGDLACYGAFTQESGAIDRLAAEGIRFTQFYAGDSLCSPSRAALLTGRLPIRSGTVGGHRVFVDYDSGGLPKNETTLPEALKTTGYYTGMTGKWHLGINEKSREDGAHLPKHHGFDFVGYNVPMSVLWDCDETGFFLPEGPIANECHLYKGDKIYQQPIRFETLTEKLVGDFKEFTGAAMKRKAPFFFYFSFPHVHTALWASKPFRGKSARGLYGDNINEMSWAVEEVVKRVEELGISHNTILLFLSDHGPHKESCIMGGSSAGLRGGKSTSFEGGFRIPAIMKWPAKIKAGLISPAVLSAMDIFPTFLKFAGVPLPNDRVYDGIEVGDQFLGKSLIPGLKLTEKRPIFFYCNKHLMAMRFRKYKIHFFTTKIFSSNMTDENCPGGMPLSDMYIVQTCKDSELISHSTPLVFDLHRDPFELYPLDPARDDRVKTALEKAKKLADDHKASVETVPDQMGKFNPKLIPCCDYPKCKCNYP